LKKKGGEENKIAKINQWFDNQRRKRATKILIVEEFMNLRGGEARGGDRAPSDGGKESWERKVPSEKRNQFMRSRGSISWLLIK